MITTLHAPEFAKEIITTLLATSNHSLDDVVAMTNRPDNVACVERKFGAFIPADQLVTIYSTAGYASIGMPAVPAPIYFQVSGDSRGILCIDVDQLANISLRDVAMCLWLCTQVDNGVLETNAVDMESAEFIYNGQTIKYSSIIEQITTILIANPFIAEDQSFTNALGMYIQPWYRDAANAVADLYGMDPSMDRVKAYLVA